MAQIKVIVDVDEDGTARVDINGTVGKACDAYVAAVRDALSGEETDSVEKATYKEKTVEKSARAIGGGWR